MQVMKRTSLDRMDENMVSLLFQVCVHWVFELQATYTIVTYLYSLTGHTRRRGPPLDFDLAGTTELDEAAPSPARCKGSIKICSCLPRLNVLHSASMHHEVSIVPLHMCVVHFPLHISSGDRMPQNLLQHLTAQANTKHMSRYSLQVRDVSLSSHALPSKFQLSGTV